MLYIQALELVSKEVAINLLEHLSMLYIQASELVSKEVAINLLEHLSMLYRLSGKGVSTCWSWFRQKQRSGNQLVGAPQYVIYSGFRAG